MILSPSVSIFFSLPMPKVDPAVDVDAAVDVFQLEAGHAGAGDQVIGQFAPGDILKEYLHRLPAREFISDDAEIYA